VEARDAVLADVAAVAADALVAAGAEGVLAGAGEDDDADRGVVADVVEGARELDDRAGAERVSHLGAVDGELGDAFIALLVADVLGGFERVAGGQGGHVSSFFARSLAPGAGLQLARLRLARGSPLSGASAHSLLIRAARRRAWAAAPDGGTRASTSVGPAGAASAAASCAGVSTRMWWRPNIAAAVAKPSPWGVVKWASAPPAPGSAATGRCSKMRPPSLLTQTTVNGARTWRTVCRPPRSWSRLTSPRRSVVGRPVATAAPAAPETKPSMPLAPRWWRIARSGAASGAKPSMKRMGRLFPTASWAPRGSDATTARAT